MHLSRSTKILLIIAPISVIVMAISIYLLVNATSSMYDGLPVDKDLISHAKGYTLSKNQSMQSLRDILEFNNDKRVSLYVEDYTSGEWMALNAQSEMLPASLLKVPTLVAVLKKAQDRELSLSTKIKLQEEDLDTRSGTLGIKGVGYELPVRDLIIDMIVDSDNTAMLALNRHLLNDEDVMEAASGLGISLGNEPKETLTPTEYSSVFRNIYFHTYIDEQYSNMALNLMTRTNFRSQLPAGLPYDVTIAHKVGFYLDGGYYHDCGIVYLTEHPYFICVMTRNMTRQQADATISRISVDVYKYMSEKS